ncbi:extracellular solute-binding protein [Oricola thermophila]|uniref:sn-glycerol-3-phosphate-binding periplasmic protein UgpB n=1 Tax=Oricola thermophila TaxID=2742145 RepID=A0A6N1VE22_9HYPH|nr:extracellular solute-binding protein [Oricola thermophila]QKV19221.1 extracellular solute-binding protein [Oricola thermophila]
MIRHMLAAGILLSSSVSVFAETEIEWWHGMGGHLGDVVNRIAEGFNESQDEYKITPVFKGSYEETLTAAIAAFRAGEQPNIVQVFDAGAATVIGAKGATVPVQDLLQANGVNFDIEDYIPGVRYFYADADGKMIGMPFNSSSPVMYYNADAFKKAGVQVPETYEEFEEIAPKLKEAGYIPLVQTHLPWEFVENFHSRHNLPFATNENGYTGAEGTKILINSPEMKHHFTRVKAWLDEGLFGFFGTGWDDNKAQFVDQKAAMYIGSSGDFGGLTALDLPFEWSNTFLPYWSEITGGEGYQTFIGGASLFAMAGHPDEENAATAKFFEYLTSPEVQYMWHRETGYVPITTAAYEMAREDGHYERFPAAETGIKQLSLRAGENTRGYRMGFYVQIRDVENRELARFLNGETSIDDALATIEKEGNELLGRFAQTLN